MHVVVHVHTEFFFFYNLWVSSNLSFGGIITGFQMKKGCRGS